MPRAIDHLVLAVPDLAAAAALYRALGFTVGSRNLHPWGTENAIVQLDGAYLELIGLADGFRPPPGDDPAAPFAGMVAGAVARGGGLAAVALASEDADADAAAFRAAGLGPGRRLDFARDAEGADGARRRLRFGLAFAELPALPEAGLFVCRHHQPFGDPAARRHPNGALALDAAVLACEAPDRVAAPLSALFGGAPEGAAARRFGSPKGWIDVAAPAEVRARFGHGAAPGRFAGFGIAVAALAPVRGLIDAARVPHDDIAGALVVPPGAAFGAALAFVPSAWHVDARGLPRG